MKIIQILIFMKIIQILIFMKIRPLGAGLLHADRRTDGQTHITQQIVVFRRSKHAPKRAKL